MKVSDEVRERRIDGIGDDDIVGAIVAVVVCTAYDGEEVAVGVTISQVDGVILSVGVRNSVDLVEGKTAAGTVGIVDTVGLLVAGAVAVCFGFT